MPKKNREFYSSATSGWIRRSFTPAVVNIDLLTRGIFRQMQEGDDFISSVVCTVLFYGTLLQRISGLPEDSEIEIINRE